MNLVRLATGILSLLIITVFNTISQAQEEQSIVQKYGQLSVKGTQVVNEKGEAIQLRGMSLFWSQWMEQFYNAKCVQWLVDDWGCTVIRASMGVEDKDGYSSQPAYERKKVERVINAAVKAGIYVVIDYHSHKAYQDPETAVKFFSSMAKKYAGTPNVIYETFNEPLNDINWTEHLKPYHEKVIAAIREYDKKNIIVCGTTTWSQDVDEASEDPLDGENIAYTIHYYAATHKQALRDKCIKAMNNGICLFCTEYGLSPASGNGDLDMAESRIWWDFLEEHKISWCNWSVADKNESSAALVPIANANGKWKDENISKSGLAVRAEIRKQHDKWK